MVRTPRIANYFKPQSKNCEPTKIFLAAFYGGALNCCRLCRRTLLRESSTRLSMRTSRMAGAGGRPYGSGPSDGRPRLATCGGVAVLPCCTWIFPDLPLRAASVLFQAWQMPGRGALAQRDARHGGTWAHAHGTIFGRMGDPRVTVAHPTVASASCGHARFPHESASQVSF